MKKGIIMEIDNRFLTLLTPEGEFLRTKKQNQLYSIGEEIYFFPMESVNATSKKSLKNIFRLKPVWVVMAALMLFMASFIPNYQDNKAYAYMSIDVNPSLELGVNKKMQVVELSGFNKEGKEILSHLKNWKKQDVSELTKTILAEMKKEGYFKDKHQVLISTVRMEQPEKKVEKKLKKNMDTIEKSVKDEKLELLVLTATEKERQKALKIGITPGKYQEAKIQSTKEKLKQEKAKANENQNKDHAVPAQSQAENTLAPGQLKKQTENNSVQSDSRKGYKESNTGKSANSPGYLKKMEEENIKQNQGQYKKQTNSQGNFRNNSNQNENHGSNKNNSKSNNNSNKNNNNSNKNNNNSNKSNSDNKGENK